MEDLLVFDKLKIESHKGEYLVNFTLNCFEDLSSKQIVDGLYIIDKNISNLYRKELHHILEKERYLIIEASESNKSLDKFEGYIDSLMHLGI